MNKPKDDLAKSRLAGILASEYGRQMTAASAFIDEVYWQTIKIQFRALKLIEFELTEGILHIGLTDDGEREMISLRAVRTKTE